MAIVIDLKSLEKEGIIKIHTKDDVRNIISMNPKSKISKNANNAYNIMKNNNEILIEGKIPVQYIIKN